MITDPIADMLTRIRNGAMAKKDKIDISPISNMKIEILKILKREGFIEDFRTYPDKRGGKIELILRYDERGESIISELKRISKPSRRVYVSKSKIPIVKQGLGIAILSTNTGLLTNIEARKKGIGGELICEIW